LNQIYSLKYGTIPIVRATGGLDDTIDEQPDGGGNGFKFRGYSSGALMDTIQRALETFRNKKLWTKMMKRAMQQDFSWEKPVQEYVRVYERAIQNRS
jgi:starch synthase